MTLRVQALGCGGTKVEWIPGPSGTGDYTSAFKHDDKPESQQKGQEGQY